MLDYFNVHLYNRYFWTMHFKSVTYVSLYNATSVLVIQCACSVREEKYLNGKIIKTGLLK